jgi:hypothetical protein
MVDLDAEPAVAEPPKLPELPELPEPTLRWGSWAARDAPSRGGWPVTRAAAAARSGSRDP